MTEEQMDKVDALVAEKVMGKEWITAFKSHKTPMGGGNPRFAPTRLDGQAAQVRRRMVELGWVPMMDYHRLNKVYHCLLAKDGICFTHGYAPTEALATCIAALRAVGVNDEEWE